MFRETYLLRKCEEKCQCSGKSILTQALMKFAHKSMLKYYLIIILHSYNDCKWVFYRMKAKYALHF